MPYTISGTLKLPESGKPASGVTLKFKSKMTVSPLVAGAESIITTSGTGTYNISLEFSVYSVLVTLYNNVEFVAGEIVLNSETQAGLDLPTLLNGGQYEPATPAWILQIQAWVTQASASAAASQQSANASAASASASAASAAQASQISGLDTVADAIGLAMLPLPDVWIPFNDSLNMLAGYGTEIKVGTDVVARRVDFTRASAATYIDKSGVMRAADINEPRFEKEGLLIEGDSTNLANSVSVLDSTSSAPSSLGVGTAYAFDGTGRVIIRYLSKLNVGKKYTISAFFRFAGAALPVYLHANGGTSSTVMAVRSPQKLVDGWARYELTIDVTADMGFLGLAVQHGMAVPCSACNLQVEAMPFATSYIPTSGAAATRAAERCATTADGNITPMSDDQTYTMCASFNFIGDIAGANRAVWGSYARPQDGLGGSSLTLRCEGGQLKSYRASGAAPFAEVRDNKIHACTVRVDTGNVKSSFFDGKKLQTVTSAPSSYGQTAYIEIGSFENGLSCAFGHIRNFRIWHSALSDAQIKGLK